MDLNKLKKKDMANPFNWVGSKHRYITEFLSVIPNKQNIKVLDSFVGGGDLISKLPVDWNITANDYMKQVYELHVACQDKRITSEIIKNMWD